MVILVCVGSSCHLKGSHEIVNLFQEALKTHGLENEVTLAGSFCTGNCNRVGVSVQIDGNTYPGVTVEGFEAFFKENVLNALK